MWKAGRPIANSARSDRKQIYLTVRGCVSSKCYIRVAMLSILRPSAYWKLPGCSFQARRGLVAKPYMYSSRHPSPQVRSQPASQPGTHSRLPALPVACQRARIARYRPVQRVYGTIGSSGARLRVLMPGVTTAQTDRPR